MRRFLSRARSERQWEIDAQTPVERALRQLNLMKNGQLTIAALLLFGKNPQRFLLQARVRCARFKGENEVEFLDLKVIEGDLIQQVEEAMSFVRRNTSMTARIEDGALSRKEHWEYPLDAVREGITNAVCHRDYADSGNVLVKIFDDRLEVLNPGGLPAGLTVEDLKNPHESKPRNKLVADAFFLIKYIEQFGTGIGRMIEECRLAGVPEPQFESRAGGFRIAFRLTMLGDQRATEMGLTERQLLLLQKSAAIRRGTTAELAKLLEVPKRTVQRDLQYLTKKGLLIRRSNGKHTSYETAK